MGLYHDEGPISFFVLNLLKDGTYKYDPGNYHGPLVYYLTSIPLSIFGLKSSVIQVNDPTLSDISFKIIPAFLGSVIVTLDHAIEKGKTRPELIAKVYGKQTISQ